MPNKGSFELVSGTLNVAQNHLDESPSRDHVVPCWSRRTGTFGAATVGTRRVSGFARRPPMDGAAHGAPRTRAALAAMAGYRPHGDRDRCSSDFHRVPVRGRSSLSVRGRWIAKHLPGRPGDVLRRDRSRDPPNDRRMGLSRRDNRPAWPSLVRIRFTKHLVQHGVTPPGHRYQDRRRYRFARGLSCENRDVPNVRSRLLREIPREE